MPNEVVLVFAVAAVDRHILPHLHEGEHVSMALAVEEDPVVCRDNPDQRDDAEREP